MLQAMRQNTKAILWVVVISFVITIFAVWGLDLQTGSTMDDPNLVGKVNGVAIPRSRYQYTYQQIAEQLRGEVAGGDLTYAQEEFARNQAWESIVYAILLDQQIEKLGITVTDQEIVDYLRGNPPQEIQQHFLDGKGQFDNAAYQAALSNPEIDWTSLEQLARERMLRIKLNEYLSAQVHVSEHETKDAYKAEMVEMSIAYVEFPIVTADVGDYRPTDEKILEHYRANPENYTEDETCRVAFVQIPMTSSSRDTADAIAHARNIREQAATGAEFGTLAQKYSEAPTSYVDGNTGFITRDKRPAAYFDALETLQDGGVSDVVVTDSGIYLLKLIDKRSAKGQTEYNAQEILVSVQRSTETTDSLYAVAAELAAKAKDSSLEKAAVERGLQVQSPPAFPRNGIVEGIGEVPALNDFAFKNEAGAVSRSLRDDQNVYVVQVMERIPERVTPLSEAREMVVQYVLLEKRRDVAERDAKAFYQKAKTSDFKTAVETYALKPKQAEKFKVGDNLDALGANSTVAQAVMMSTSGHVIAPVEWRLTLYVVDVLARTDIAEDDYRTKMASIRRGLHERKAQAYAQGWYENLQKEAEIDDYRNEG
jgi:parvulin-like peptidyl-prolyl isomerase